MGRSHILDQVEDTEGDPGPAPGAPELARTPHPQEQRPGQTVQGEQDKGERSRAWGVRLPKLSPIRPLLRAPRRPPHRLPCARSSPPNPPLPSALWSFQKCRPLLSFPCLQPTRSHPRSPQDPWHSGEKSHPLRIWSLAVCPAAFPTLSPRALFHLRCPSPHLLPTLPSFPDAGVARGCPTLTLSCIVGKCSCFQSFPGPSFSALHWSEWVWSTVHLPAPFPAALCGTCRPFYMAPSRHSAGVLQLGRCQQYVKETYRNT